MYKCRRETNQQTISIPHMLKPYRISMASLHRNIPRAFSTNGLTVYVSRAKMWCFSANMPKHVRFGRQDNPLVFAIPIYGEAIAKLFLWV